jgi:hypothetical protein
MLLLAAGDMPERAQLMVGELLDTMLIGEGVLQVKGGVQCA